MVVALAVSLSLRPLSRITPAVVRHASSASRVPGTRLFNSLKIPQVPELSGVGNAMIFQNTGVPVVLEFPQLGEKLQDWPAPDCDRLHCQRSIMTLGEKLARWILSRATV